MSKADDDINKIISGLQADTARRLAEGSLGFKKGNSANSFGLANMTKPHTGESIIPTDYNVDQLTEAGLKRKSIDWWIGDRKGTAENFNDVILGEVAKYEHGSILGDENFASQEYGKMAPEVRVAQQFLSLDPATVGRFLDMYDNPTGMVAQSPEAAKILKQMRKSGLDFNKVYSYVKSSKHHAGMMQGDTSLAEDLASDGDPFAHISDTFVDPLEEALTNTLDRSERTRSQKESMRQIEHLMNWAASAEADVLPVDPIMYRDVMSTADKMTYAARSLIGHYIDTEDFRALSPGDAMEAVTRATELAIQHVPNIAAGRSRAMASIDSEMNDKLQIEKRANINREAYDTLYERLEADPTLKGIMSVEGYDKRGKTDEEKAEYKFAWDVMRKISKNPESGYLQKSREDFRRPAYLRDYLAAEGKWDYTSVASISESDPMYFYSGMSGVTDIAYQIDSNLVSKEMWNDIRLNKKSLGSLQYYNGTSIERLAEQANRLKSAEVQNELVGSKTLARDRAGQLAYKKYESWADNEGKFVPKQPSTFVSQFDGPMQFPTGNIEGYNWSSQAQNKPAGWSTQDYLPNNTHGILPPDVSYGKLTYGNMAQHFNNPALFGSYPKLAAMFGAGPAVTPVVPQQAPLSPGTQARINNASTGLGASALGSPHALGGSTAPSFVSSTIGQATSGGAHMTAGERAQANFFATNPNLRQGPTDDDKLEAGSQWMAARWGLFTSSAAGEIDRTTQPKKKSEFTGRQKTTRGILEEALGVFDPTRTPDVGSSEQRAGDAIEELVGERLRQKYSDVFSPGLITDVTKPGQGTTPDFMTPGVVHEVKSRRNFIDPNNLNEDPWDHDKVAKNFAQMQHQMYMTGARKGYLHEVIRDTLDDHQPLGRKGLIENKNYKVTEYDYDEKYVDRMKPIWEEVGKFNEQISRLDNSFKTEFAEAVKEGNLASFEELAKKHNIQGASAYARHMGLTGGGGGDSGNTPEQEEKAAETFAENLIGAFARIGTKRGGSGGGGGILGTILGAIPGQAGMFATAAVKVGSEVFETMQQANDISLQQDTLARAAGFTNDAAFREAKSDIRGAMGLGDDEANATMQMLTLAKGGMQSGDPTLAKALISGSLGTITMQSIMGTNPQDSASMEKFLENTRKEMDRRGMDANTRAAIAHKTGLTALTADSLPEGRKKLNAFMADVEEIGNDIVDFGANFFGHSLSTAGMLLPYNVVRAIQDTTGKSEEGTTEEKTKQVTDNNGKVTQTKTSKDDGVVKKALGAGKGPSAEMNTAEMQDVAVKTVMQSLGYEFNDITEANMKRGRELSKSWTRAQTRELMDFATVNTIAKGEGSVTKVVLETNGVSVTTSDGKTEFTPYKPTTEGK